MTLMEETMINILLLEAPLKHIQLDIHNYRSSTKNTLWLGKWMFCTHSVFNMSEKSEIWLSKECGLYSLEYRGLINRICKCDGTFWVFALLSVWNLSVLPRYYQIIVFVLLPMQHLRQWSACTVITIDCLETSSFNRAYQPNETLLVRHWKCKG